MPTNPQPLIEKIKALPAERIDEVEDFVDFIATRIQDRALTRAATAASAPTFHASGTTPATTFTMPFEFGDTRRLIRVQTNASRTGRRVSHR